MNELLRDALRWVERDGKMILQVKRYIFHEDKKATLFGERQGSYETVWDDVQIAKEEGC